MVEFWWTLGNNVETNSIRLDDIMNFFSLFLMLILFTQTEIKKVNISNNKLKIK